MSVSGQRETANGFVVNGSNVEEDFNMGTAIVPNLDAIQEMRVLVSKASMRNTATSAAAAGAGHHQVGHQSVSR